MASATVLNTVPTPLLYIAVYHSLCYCSGMSEIWEVQCLNFPVFPGSSAAMEYHGFVKCMEYLLGCGLLVKTFVSDRHTVIAKHVREKLANIKHYFDI